MRIVVDTNVLLSALRSAHGASFILLQLLGRDLFTVHVSVLNVRLPDSLHQQVRELAERDRISINQFIALAVAEKVASLVAMDYVRQRMLRGNRARFDRVLEKISAANHPPDDVGRLPVGSTVKLPQA